MHQPKLTRSLTTYICPFHFWCTQKYRFEKANWKRVQLSLSAPPWLHTKFDVIENRLAQGDTSHLVMDSVCLNRDHCLYLLKYMKSQSPSGWKITLYYSVTKPSARILDVIVHCQIANHQLCCRFSTHWIETKVNFDSSPSPCHTIISMSLVRMDLISWILLNIQFRKFAKRYLCKPRQQIQIGLFLDFCDVSAN